MLGGHEITAKTRAHAKELLAQQQARAAAPESERDSRPKAPAIDAARATAQLRYAGALTFAAAGACRMPGAASP